LFALGNRIRVVPISVRRGIGPDASTVPSAEHCPPGSPRADRARAPLDRLEAREQLAQRIEADNDDGNRWSVGLTHGRSKPLVRVYGVRTLGTCLAAFSTHPFGWSTVRLAQWLAYLPRSPGNCAPGRGNSVVGRTPKEVQLAWRGRTVTVSRTLVELATRRPPIGPWCTERRSRLVHGVPAAATASSFPSANVDTVRCPRCKAVRHRWGARGRRPPRRGGGGAQAGPRLRRAAPAPARRGGGSAVPRRAAPACRAATANAAPR